MPARICCRCQRSESSHQGLEWTTLARGGSLFEVCRLCFLIEQIGELCPRLEPESLAVCTAALEEVYIRARTDLAASVPDGD